jgi:hypothetical protein
MLSCTKRPGALFTMLCLLAMIATACKFSSLPDAKMNMFEGTNAWDGITKIKQKLGVDDLKLRYAAKQRSARRLRTGSLTSFLLIGQTSRLPKARQKGRSGEPKNQKSLNGRLASVRWTIQSIKS